MDNPLFHVSSIEYDTGAHLLERSLQLLDDNGGPSQPLLRWYVPTDKSIVLGRGQKVVNEHPDFAVVSRPSGGGAVLLDPTLLSVDVVIPRDHPWLDPRNVSASFLPVGLAFKLALTELGIANIELFTQASQASRLGSDDEAMIAEICYASMGRGELMVNGQKIVGLSQRHRRHGTLIQCGILHTWKPDPLIHAFAVEPVREAVYEAAIGIDDLTDQPLSDEVLRCAVSLAMVTVSKMDPEQYRDCSL